MKARAPFHCVSAYALRGFEYASESRDCTVRALVAAACLEYKDAHAMMELAGRRLGRGADPFLGLEIGKELGMLEFKRVPLRGKPDQDSIDNALGLFTETELRDPTAKRHPSPVRTLWVKGRYVYGSQPERRITLNMVLKKIPSGRFILCTMDHAFAVVNGIVLDSRALGLSCKVVACYQVFPMEAK